MRHINKVLSYFSSIYVNSTRYNHSTAGWLQVFFERNNKYKSTVSNLGSVFKNSKWSDFKSQNIKETLIKDWIFIAAVLIFIFFSYCILLGLLKSDSLLRSVPFLNKLIETLTELWVPLTDYINYIFVCLGSYYISILFELRKKFMSTQVVDLNNSFVSSPAIHQTIPLEPLNTLQVDSTKSTNQKAAVLRSMNSVNGLLDNSQTSAEDFNFEVLNTGALPLIKNFKTKVWFITIKNSRSLFTNQYQGSLESPYTLIADEETLKLTLNPHTISWLQKNVQFTPNNLNMMSQLSLAKQDRWFLKNSLLGDSLTKSTSNFTQSKKLITSNAFTSSTSNNVWLSSKAGGLNSAEALKFATVLNKLVSPNMADSTNLLFSNTSICHINSFEDSRFFFAKRYFFTNQLKNNVWESQNIQHKGLDLTTQPIATQIPLVYTKSLAPSLGNLVTANRSEFYQTNLADTSKSDLSLNLVNNSMLDLSNSNFINKVTSISTDSSTHTLLSKANGPTSLISFENSFYNSSKLENTYDNDYSNTPR